MEVWASGGIQSVEWSIASIVVRRFLDCDRLGGGLMEDKVILRIGTFTRSSLRGLQGWARG
jgi:hypothetical protein